MSERRHAWSSDPARDAAVRAAEDGRSGPLPTLKEAIAAVTKTMSENGIREEMEQGMRTDRVVFEVTHLGPRSAAEWDWSYHIRPRHIFESVRVVSDEEREEPPRVHCGSGVFDSNGDEVPWEDVVATLAEEREAAAQLSRAVQIEPCGGQTEKKCTERERQAASGGNGQGSLDGSTRAASGDGEPVADAKPFAWAVVEKGKASAWCYAFRSDRDQAQREFSASDFSYFPLYRQPPRPRGWLTHDERSVLDVARTILDQSGQTNIGITIDALLASSTPPEVVLPALFSRSNLGDRLLVEQQVRQALAAAGVVVKEVV
jgi:hypothetical protein